MFVGCGVQEMEYGNLSVTSKPDWKMPANLTSSLLQFKTHENHNVKKKKKKIKLHPYFN